MAIQDNDSLLESLQDCPQTFCSPRDEKWEKDLTEALVEISEKILEDDQKSIEWLIGTGWEEAACGWGPVSATACLHPQKKQKKLKAGEAMDCILCLHLCFIHECKDTAAETKSSTVTNHKEKCPATPLPAEKDVGSGFTGHCPSTAMVSKTETYSDKQSSVEASIREQRPNKEKNIQRSSSPFTGRAIPVCTNCYNTKEPLNAPMLLPPLKASPGNSHAEQVARRKEILLQHLEKLPSKGLMGSTLSGQFLHTIDLRVERKLLEAMSDLSQERVPEPLSFVTSSIPKTPVKDADRLQWQKALLQKSIAVNANSVKHGSNSAHVGFLHTKTMQNKRNIRPEVRQQNDPRVRRAKSGTSQVPRNTVLPSLTVTRVEIPVKIKLY
ncbi:uncharacterized protein C16orf46 homolog [Hyla sarda]|uniref:uncharacterized protein C16orf46 homolog n=1 Tax=Hyla sarda TaxID=327740 RepID=UPI0024C2FF4B|nr:uncharacterized protein C16orf46 homolog [Hyla sarda]XP_056382161.1 uncharacterized protein C16orf46 homolog [Hyla sarda]XP_056382162.1 uncharacterized protein C16orf46 homolog [Hyla sarda]